MPFTIILKIVIHEVQNSKKSPNMVTIRILFSLTALASICYLFTYDQRIGVVNIYKNFSMDQRMGIMNVYKNFSKLFYQLPERLRWIDLNPMFVNFNLSTPPKQKNVTIIIIVSTAPKRFDRRMAIRETWWKQCVPKGDVSTFVY